MSTPSSASVHVLFFCLGNICRSPIAEGYFRHLVQEHGLADKIYIDSAATSHWEVGNGPHPMSVKVCAQYGVRLAGQSRQLEPKDLETFHYLLGMDHNNIQDARSMLKATGTDAEKIHLLRTYDPEGAGVIKDPYGLTMPHYEEVYAQVARSCQGLLRHLRQQHNL